MGRRDACPTDRDALKPEGTWAVERRGCQAW
jgi:hypothetical protein